MINILRRIIVPQFTYPTVVRLCDVLFTIIALRSRELHSTTVHAPHFFCCIPVHGMIAGLIVAKATSEKLFTARRFQLTTSLVMLATKNLLCCRLVRN